jgi:hypothetical protein
MWAESINVRIKILERDAETLAVVEEIRQFNEIVGRPRKKGEVA